MPRLLRGVARTAVVAGTASAVAGRVQRRQAEKFADRDAQIYAQRDQAYQQAVPQQAAAPPSAAPDDPVAKLQQLSDMKSKGLLTDEEFAAAKAKILG